MDAVRRFVGSTLALAYAVQHLQHVSGMILYGVTTGRHREIEWLFRSGVSIFFPEQWERLRAGLPAPVPDRAVVDAYYDLLNHPDAVVRQRAADAWCLWESATVDWPPSTQLAGRFTDSAFALAFARVVTHYMHHNLFLEDAALMRGAGALAGIPGRLVNGRFDFQAPIANAWELHRAWPRADLVIVDEAGHSGNAAMIDALIRATDDFR